ncbi:hypothetical protein M8J77_017397 [Diaphorina citri]|nr:hypothetical protein M8J77_017397 [Diaphorina citri]
MLQWFLMSTIACLCVATQYDDYTEDMQADGYGLYDGAQGYCDEEYPITTDISCWMGNTRISQTCSLERCDQWKAYNAVLTARGFACLTAKYSVDGIEHVYRNCVHSQTARYDPCDKVIGAADNIRVDLFSCDICWDNGCNMEGYRNLYYRNFVFFSGFNPPYDIIPWTWYLIIPCLLCSLVCCYYFCCHLKCRYMCMYTNDDKPIPPVCQHTGEV